MIQEYFAKLIAGASALDWMTLIAVIISVTTLLEKTFKVDVIGRRIFRLLGHILKFLFKRLIMPFHPEIERFKKYWNDGKEFEKKFLEYLETQKLEKEQSFQEKQIETQRFTEFGETLEAIRKEVTFNGGSSMKDAVAKLVEREPKNWTLLNDLNRQLKVVSLRQDISDESDGRMSFFLDADQKCTQISANYLRHFGYAEKDVLGINWDFCVQKKNRTAVRKLWREAFKKTSVYREDQIIVASNGEEYKCLVCGYPQFDQEEKFLGFYGTIEIIEDEEL